MAFLAAVAWVAYREGRGPAVLASLLAVLSFDFFFVPPIHTFVFADAQYAVTFLVMLTIGLVISSLTSRLRAQVESARFRERRITTLYELGKSLSAVYGIVFIVNAAVERIEELVGGETAVYLVQDDGEPELVVDRSSRVGASPAVPPPPDGSSSMIASQGLARTPCRTPLPCSSPSAARSEHWGLSRFVSKIRKACLIPRFANCSMPVPDFWPWRSSGIR